MVMKVLRRHDPALMPTGKPGGGKNAAAVSTDHIINLALAAFVAPRITESATALLALRKLYPQEILRALRLLDGTLDSAPDLELVYPPPPSAACPVKRQITVPTKLFISLGRLHKLLNEGQP